MSVSCDNNLSCNLQRDLKLHELLLKREYSLNAVNNYGDSLLHVSAAHGCAKSVKTILEQNKNCLNINRKNKFGWTPLMHAIRANNIQTVKVLLDNGADASQRTYLGTSTLTLAAGIGLEMFETILKARPSMLDNSAHDDISPLCIAAVRNDKKLFFKLVELGLEPKNESIYTHLVMRQSVYPEIRDLAEAQTGIEEYWSDGSDNIRIIGRESSRGEDGSGGDLSRPATIDQNVRNSLPSIFVNSPKERAANSMMKSLHNRKESKLPNLDLLSLKEARIADSQSISPNLIYNLDSWFAKSPNFCFSPNPNSLSTAGEMPRQKACLEKQQTQRNVFVFEKVGENPYSVIPEHRARDDPAAGNQSIDHNTSLSFVPEFSPSRSPCLPADFEDEDVCGEDTPTPPHYKTPPRGMVLNSEQAKLVITLKQFDLAHHISRFLAEEVDMNLFLTLNDRDLTEIGIADERDRKELLALIDAFTKDEKH